MRSRPTRRLAALALALTVSSLLQACAVTTGSFVPVRGTASNRSMTSRFDVLRQQSVGNPGVVGRMRTTHETGLFDFRYY
jgi:hypothetical protein